MDTIILVFPDFSTWFLALLALILAVDFSSFGPDLGLIKPFQPWPVHLKGLVFGKQLVWERLSDKEHSLCYAGIRAAEAVEIYSFGNSLVVSVSTIPHYAVDAGFHVFIYQGVYQLSLKVVDV